MTFFTRILSTIILPMLAVQAHMQLKEPKPLRSRFDPANTGYGVDYDMMRHLSRNGSDFPCFGYHLSGDQHTTVTYKAGNPYSINIYGEASHGGGSCQLSLSYDNGDTFKVIKSMIGNCPTQADWNFTIPPTVPSGDNVLFAWTWFNKRGNREMYMNCARVKIENPSSSASESGLNELPNMFTANIYGPSTCITPDETEIIFADPGKEVEYASNMEHGQPTAMEGSPCPGGNNQSSGTYPSQPDAEEEAGSVAPEPTAPIPSPEVPSTGGVSNAAPSSAPLLVPAEQADSTGEASSAVRIPAPTTAAASPEQTAAGAPSSAVVAPAPSGQPNAGSGVCTLGAIICAPNGKTWSFCMYDGKLQDMGKVAAGMVCKNGAMHRAE